MKSIALEILESVQLECKELLDKGDAIIEEINKLKLELGLEVSEYPKQATLRCLEAQKELDSLMSLKQQRQYCMKTLMDEISGLQIQLGIIKDDTTSLGLTAKDINYANELILKLHQEKQVVEYQIEDKLYEICNTAKIIEEYLPTAIKTELERLNVNEIIEDESIKTVDLSLRNDLNLVWAEMEKLQIELSGRLNSAIQELQKLVIDLEEPKNDGFKHGIGYLAEYEAMVLELREKYKLKMKDTILKSLHELVVLWDKCQINITERKLILEVVERGIQF